MTKRDRKKKPPHVDGDEGQERQQKEKNGDEMRRLEKRVVIKM